MKLTEIKQLNEGKFLTDPDDIIQWFAANFIIDPEKIERDRQKIHIHSDGVVDFNFSLEATRWNSDESKKLSRLEVQFGNCVGRFNFGYHNLTSFDGFPHTVGKECIVTGNARIKYLKGCPPNMKDSFEIGGTGITSLIGVERHIKTCRWIGASFDKITEGGIGLLLINGLQSISTGAGEKPHLPPPFQIIKKYLGRPNDIYECQSELIEAGYQEYAQL